MEPEKKTEQELRNEIITEFELEEDDQRVEQILELKKDKFSAIQSKKKQRDLLEKMEKGKNFYKKQAKKGGDSQTGELSFKDGYALQQANVHIDNVDDVVDYAKFKGITVSEAVKTNYIKTLVRESAEERETAAAANTKSGRRGVKPDTGSELLNRAQKTGELPDDDKSMQALINAQLGVKQK